MAIKRYFATKDNTITNAYEFNLRTRATGSNMGQADILEVFSIYGQASTASVSSSEVCRSLIQFPVSDISTDRTAGTVPASGSVNFYLKLYNAPHSQTVPKDFTLMVKPVSSSWQEGHGLDMHNYTDLTRDITGSNWVNANNNFTAATATITALSKTSGQANTRKLLITDSSGDSVNFTIDNSVSTSTATVIAFGNANSNANQFATNIAAAVNAADTAGTLNISATASTATVTLTMGAKGIGGNGGADISGTAVTDSVVTIASQFSGGDGQWATEGGDYHTTNNFSQSFPTGSEDLEIDVTPIIEEWIAGTKTNYGFGLMLTASQEASGSTNLTGSSRSYYTKKFFGRGSEFFFRRPVIEARWDSSRRDQRGEFYYSSSLAPAADNLNTLYIYNYVRGQLTNIPDVGTGAIYVDLFSGSTGPAGTKLIQSVKTPATGGYVSTGIYSCSVCLTAAATPLTKLFDVWHGGDSGDTYHTGTITPIGLSGSNINPTNTYVTTITNLRPIYRRVETARFRLFTRQKDWNPTIYTKASKAIKGTTITSGSYRLYRIADEFDVIPHGTGSTKHTILSYDITGSYFDLDMSMLEEEYAYAIEFSYYNGALGSWVKQPEVFKFRVE